MNIPHHGDHGTVTTIVPRRGLLHLPFGELWDYRELIALLAHRDFVSQYKQTILGSFWYFLQPLLQSLMFVFVFSRVAKIPTGNIPPILFYLSGTVCWRYFSDCVTKTANTFTSNQNIFDKVYFPRLAVPVSQLVTNLVGFGMGLLLFVVFYLWFYLHDAPIHPDWRLIVLPVLVIQMAALGLGVGCLISGLTSRFRDLQVLLGFFMQLWMYASCVVYPLNVVRHREFSVRLHGGGNSDVRAGGDQRRAECRNAFPRAHRFQQGRADKRRHRLGQCLPCQKHDEHLP